MQFLVYELVRLRDHNLQFTEASPETDRQILLFAEAAVCLVAMERFLRIVLGSRATNKDTLPNLLQKATSKSLRLLELPGDREVVIKQITAVRNTLLHGNYEQAAAEAGCSDVRHYFATQFAAEIERLTQFLNYLLLQIDPETGEKKNVREDAP